MFISKQAYQDLKLEVITAKATADAQSKANIVLEANMNWFRHRLTQIEAERAQLIHHALGVKIPTPEFHQADAVKQFMDDHKFDTNDIFRGLSDAEAVEQGVALDNEGRLNR